ncbi:two-component sensor histidine kinase [Campylobacter jejuni]|uniref:ArsS family sensor histidine kinase n=1 Tax=Campylobacter jejuni TaxID=197 RepID=UPI0008FCDF21|nr:ArsS family sensor histidine kinase [Campylobacter jejuni]EDO1338345.1 two-component sensor histidine kinase [Campylobacter jejuni]EDO1344730.1 two-component sensor histidine kinase [Campylobacter jejuni]OIU60840.1 two-component sensor histidine kinase [Campylobacter jejuni]OIU60959.1 two-component sensor histidine kinase [Campylobacter jejuni]OIU64305.1 two-component sensor histidine kinase [Campylobacter jejuni]
MTKNYSIHTKLIILFVVTFFLVCVLFIVLLKIEGNTYNEEESLKQENLIKNLLISYENTSGVEIGAYLGNSGFNAVQNPNLVKAIRNNGQSLFKAGGELCTLSSLKYHSNLYFDVQCKDFDGLYEENTSDRVYNLLLIGFFSFSLLVVFMYFSVLKSLEPLKKLRRQVAEVANGEQPNFLDYQEDEVGKIAFEFQKAFKKNQELIQSRQLFLRTIMHELKTRRIISEMIKEDRQKERLIAIFLRMDSLINEFAKIENLFSKNYNLHFKPSRFSTILEEAKEHLMRDDFNKVVKVDIRYDALINVDMEIFSVILKNLIDNALKYSNNGTCELFCCKECFTIKNPGKPLAEPIEHYLEAFTREKHNQVKGMGLGLYIVSEVCKLHNFDLIYFYDDGKHCFKIFFGDKEK